MFDKTEEEQIQIIKDWVKKYYLWVVAIIFIGAAGTFGWNYNEEQNTLEQRRIAAIYENIISLSQTLQNVEESKKQETLEELSNAVSNIQDLYPENIYTSMSKLLYASALATNQQFEDAEKELKILITEKSNIIKDYAKLALAKILWQQNKVDDALSLTANLSAGFSALGKELEGDIYFSQGDKKKASVAYQAATKGQEGNNLLQMKLNNAKK